MFVVTEEAALLTAPLPVPSPPPPPLAAAAAADVVVESAVPHVPFPPLIQLVQSLANPSHT